MKDFLNFDDVYESILGIYKEVIEDFGYEHREDCYDLAEERATFSAIETLDSMRRYVHMKNTHMNGSFCDIRADWDLCPEFVSSDIQPWGKFDDVIKSIDDETISEKDVAKGQQYIEVEGKTPDGEDYAICIFDTYFEDESNSEILSTEKIEWMTTHHRNLYQAEVVQRAIFDEKISVEDFAKGYEEIEQSEFWDDAEFIPEVFNALR